MGKDNYISFHFGCPPPRTTSSSKLVFHLKSSSLELGWKQRKTHHHPNSFWLQCDWPAAERLSSFIKWHIHIFTHNFKQLPALGLYIDIHCGQSNPNPNLNLTSIHTPPLTSAGTSELMFCCISTSLWSPWGLLVPTKTQTHTHKEKVWCHITLVMGLSQHQRQACRINRSSKPVCWWGSTSSILLKNTDRRENNPRYMEDHTLWEYTANTASHPGSGDKGPFIMNT